jgi:hypothetical protein
VKTESSNHIRLKGVPKKDEWVEVGRKCGGPSTEKKSPNKAARMSRKRN